MARSPVTPKAFLRTAGLLWIALFTIAESAGVGPTSTPLPNPDFSKYTHVFTLVARCVCAYFVRLLKAVVNLYKLTVRQTKILVRFLLVSIFDGSGFSSQVAVSHTSRTLALIQLTFPICSLVRIYVLSIPL